MIRWRGMWCKVERMGRSGVLVALTVTRKHLVQLLFVSTLAVAVSQVSLAAGPSDVQSMLDTAVSARASLSVFQDDQRTTANDTLSARGAQRPTGDDEPSPQPAETQPAPVDPAAVALAARTQQYEQLGTQLISQPQSRLDNANYRNILSDQAFAFGDGAGQEKMSLSQIDAFLLQRAPALAGYRTASEKSVSQILFDAAQAYNVNPMLLLTKLQVEQSLLDAQALSSDRLDWALGVGVNGYTRDQAAAGLETQVSRSAQLLAKLFAEGKRLTFPLVFPWAVNDAPDNALRSALPTRLVVDNAATYALFRYTPHTVSSGALSNPGGGNYLLVRVFTTLFGPRAMAGAPYQEP